MSSLLKKFVFSTLVVLTLFFSTASFFQAKAQSNWYNQGLFDWYAKVYDSNSSPPNEIFGERYTAAQVQWVFYSLFSTLFNIIPGNPDLFLCLINGQIDNCVSILPTELQEVLDPVTMNTPDNRSLASVYMQHVNNGSISGIGYAKNLTKKISPVTSVKAADDGTGLNAGKSVLSLWKITRNVSFSLLVLVTVALAFMIMFRVKINPQTVITIQSAIPKLVVALILITFSYAIAGLVIDLMYVVIGLIATIITSGGLSGYTAPELFDQFLSKFSGFGVMYAYWWHLLANAFLSIFNSGKQWWAGIILFFVSIFVLIAAFIWSLKIIFVMIKNFALLMLTIVAGPFEILLGTINGKSGFGSWLNRLVSYVAVYPVLVIMIFFSFFFLKQGANVQQGPAMHTPFHPTNSVIGAAPSFNPPFSIGTSGSESQLIWVLVSLFIFSQITKVVEIVQSFFSGKPFEYGTGIGEAVGFSKMAGQGGLAYGFGKYEERRMEAAKLTGSQYEPAAVTQLLRSVGIIKK